MSACPACNKSIPADSRLCPYCGRAVASVNSTARPTDLGETVDAATDATVTTPGASATTRLPSRSDSDVHGRFLPGTALTDRYRIVGLLGKGGMGEVYRADDLELNQSVALKFLPGHFAQDAARLQRFRAEVRTARQVSHPNVCRVYDIATYGDDVFLSMEYIDGEDLSSVLRRMGRPSEEKAVEWARQICMGLAAAHENRVLHRDLKPANVMIDGRGRARLTDFGLAGVEEEFAGRKDHAGTPAYMAPEQLIDGATTIKSDIYSLGLVLYELFTGKRVFEAESVDELLRLRRSDTLTTPTSVSGQIDPAIERAILRCLERDPSRRPDSAYEVLADLPGGDPLQAALAAGETPSPQMVANAGTAGALRPRVALACLVTFVAMVIASVPLNNIIWQIVPLEKPPTVLAEKARELIDQLGYASSSADHAYGFTQSEEEITDYQGDNGDVDASLDALQSHRPPAIHFWYRQSPDLLIPISIKKRVTVDDPPMNTPGMVTLLLDARGRLDRFTAVPPRRDESAAAKRQEPDWAKLFEAADLAIADFEPARPQWTPPGFADERRAWVGAYPERPEASIRIEAAAYRGMPTYFRIVGPWSTPNAVKAASAAFVERIMQVVMPTVLVLLAGTTIWMARRNARLHRVDFTGATRFALAMLFAGSTSFILTTDHSIDMKSEVTNAIENIALALFVAAMVWLFYLAMEPHVRRRWPETLITWSRVLMGKFRDPRVGRDILVGGIIGLTQHLITEGKDLIRLYLFDAPSDFSSFTSYHTFLGGRQLIGEFFLPMSFTFPILLLTLMFVFRLFLRRDWAMAVIFIVLGSFPNVLRVWLEAGTTLGVLQLFSGVAYWGLMLFVFIRFGLFAAMAASFIHMIFHRFPLTLDPSDWYFNLGLVPLGVVLALGVYGFIISLGGQSLVRDELLEE